MADANFKKYICVLGYLQYTKGRWPSIAKQSGVKLRTLEKIARRETCDPRDGNVNKLISFFEPENAA
jgi:hypothetical protein